jgi:hypothetical protein
MCEGCVYGGQRSERRIPPSPACEVTTAFQNRLRAAEGNDARTSAGACGRHQPTPARNAAGLATGTAGALVASVPWGRAAWTRGGLERRREASGCHFGQRIRSASAVAGLLVIAVRREGRLLDCSTMLPLAGLQ